MPSISAASPDDPGQPDQAGRRGRVARRAAFLPALGLEGCPLSQARGIGTPRSSSVFFQDGAGAPQPTNLDRPDFGSAAP
jgi:hypothetical protein